VGPEGVLGRRFGFEDEGHRDAGGHVPAARAILESETVGGLLRERGLTRVPLAP